MNDAQIWAIIGLLAAALASFVALTISLVLRVLTTQIAAATSELRSGFRSEISTLHCDLGGRLDTLDRDLQAIAARVFRDDD